MKTIKTVLIVFGVITFCFTGHVFALEKVTLQLKWEHQFQFAGYYAAIEKGFYKDAGLNVVIKPGGPSIKVDQEVLSGKAHFGILASELIGKKVYGEKLVLVAVVFQHSNRALIIRADSNIFSPSDLIGQTIMLNSNEQEEFLAMFKREGISPEKIMIVPKNGMANKRLIDREVMAINGSIGNQPYYFQQKGVDVKLMRPIAYGIDFYGDSIFTSEQELQHHPNRVVRFRDASLQGWEYAMHNPEEIIQLICNKYNSSRTAEHLRFEAQALRSIILPDLVELGHINLHRLKKTAAVYAQHSIIKKDYSLEGFVFDPAQREKKSAARFKKIVVSAGVVLLSLAIMFLIWTFLLRRTVAVKTAALSEEIAVRRKTEASLKESERQLKMMIEKSPLPMMITDINQDIKFYNEKFIELFGYTLDDISTAEKWWETCYPDKDYRHRVQQTWKSAIEKSKANNTDLERQEWELTIKDKSKRLCEFFMVPLSGLSLTIINDITDRKQMEQTLRDSEERFRNIIQNTKAGYFFIDQQGRFQNVNNAWLKMHKFSSAAEIVGKHYSTTQLGEDTKLAQEKVETTMSGISIRADEFSRLNKDGSIGYHLYSTNPVEKQGEIIGLEGFLIDITKRKRAEDLIKSSLKEKEILLHEIHHRVKNNMTVISSLLKLQANRIDDERIKSALMDSDSRVQSMSTIHETLYQSENLSSVDMSIYLSKLAGEILKNYGFENKVSLIVESDNILIAVKQASPLGLIVNELITNSIKYAFPDTKEGEITIKLRKTEQNQIEMEYADNGIGMPKDFDWHGAKSMGLKLVKMLSEVQLGGSVEMESDRGAQFRITFDIET